MDRILGRVALCAALAIVTITPVEGHAQEAVQYGYDALGRVTTVTYNGFLTTYVYDAAGNRTLVTAGTGSPGGGGGGNQNPVAVGDYFETRATTTVLSVLANDSDPNGHPLHISAVSAPTGGTATITNGGTTVSYVKPAGFGTFTFSYTANDGQGGTAVASVEVVVKKLQGYCDRYPDDPYC